MHKTRVLITGSNGFIGKNLKLLLSEKKTIQILEFTKKNSIKELEDFVFNSDFVFHLAGINRPQTAAEFNSGNIDLTQALCKAIKKTNRSIPIVFTSSIQANLENAYGRSKKKAEDAIRELNIETSNPIHIFRLPNVFGKWAKPNYNSVVATFCYSIARNLNIEISDPKHLLSLVYIDDVIQKFMNLLEASDTTQDTTISPTYTISLGSLAEKINTYHKSRTHLITPEVGTGLDRALHATYLSYLPTINFSYPLEKHEDPRGVFVEMLKTTTSGQFSYFTAHPGVTRGGHYHHTKTEKFLVVSGNALFRFRHALTGESYQLESNANNPVIIETVPGWIHDITNIGEGDMIVLLWANELFDKRNPDTYAKPIKDLE